MTYYYKNINLSDLFEPGTISINDNYKNFPNFSETNNLAAKIDTNLPYKISGQPISSLYSISATSQTLDGPGTFSLPVWCNSIKTIIQVPTANNGSSGNDGNSLTKTFKTGYNVNYIPGNAPVTNPGVPGNYTPGIPGNYNGTSPINNPAIPGNITPGIPGYYNGTQPYTTIFGTTIPGIPGNYNEGTPPIDNGTPASTTPGIPGNYNQPTSPIYNGIPESTTPGTAPQAIGYTEVNQTYTANGGKGGAGGKGGTGLSVQICSPTPYIFNTPTTFSYSVNNLVSQFNSSNKGSLISVNLAQSGNSGTPGNDGNIDPGPATSFRTDDNGSIVEYYANVRVINGNDGTPGNDGSSATVTLSPELSNLTINQTTANNSRCQIYYFYT